MASVSNNGLITFGFKNVNGRLFRLEIVRATRGTFVNRLTLPTIRNRVVALMNKYGKNAERIAKSPGWSPFLTGALVNSIHWRSARRRSFTGLIIGDLAVDVPYGRRQEFEHRSRPYYLRRAIDSQFPAFAAEVQDQRVMTDILLGRKFQVGGAQVVGGFF